MLGKQKFTIELQTIYLQFDFIRIRHIRQKDYVGPILDQRFGRHDQRARAGDVLSLPCRIDFHDMADCTFGIDQVQKSNSSASRTPCRYLPSRPTKFVKPIPPIRHLVMEDVREPAHSSEILSTPDTPRNRMPSHFLRSKRAFDT
jgi:hypothetical protein